MSIWYWRLNWIRICIDLLLQKRLEHLTFIFPTGEARREFELDRSTDQLWVTTSCTDKRLDRSWWQSERDRVGKPLRKTVICPLVLIEIRSRTDKKSTHTLRTSGENSATRTDGSHLGRFCVERMEILLVIFHSDVDLVLRCMLLPISEGIAILKMRRKCCQQICP